MKQILKEFFSKNIVALDAVSKFQDTDLYDYLSQFYGAKPVFSDTGFVKVVEQDNKIFLSEHIYYDYCPESDEQYISLPGLEIQSSRITNTDLGYAMSKNGFAVAPLEKDYRETTDLMPVLPYTSVKGSATVRMSDKYEETDDPKLSFKWNRRVWEEPHPQLLQGVSGKLYQNTESLFSDLLSFSGVLSALDKFDLNILQWEQGRRLVAHNAMDYKCFVQALSYNTNDCEKSRGLILGEFDWYDTTMKALETNCFDALQKIETEKTPMDKIIVDTDKAILLNSFNPKFYHEVETMESMGQIYTCSALKGFKSITERFTLDW